MNDFQPYIFMTNNFGKTWQKISSNLPSDDYVKVVRQDPHNLICSLLEWNTEFLLAGTWEKIGKKLM